LIAKIPWSAREKGGYSPEPRVYDLSNLPNAPFDQPIGSSAPRKDDAEKQHRGEGTK
jgi:hypothetical protein